jgi:ATP-dependent DNA helicase DinG
MCNVESPFDYQSNAVLYCAKHLPNPNSPDFTKLMHDELFHLIAAAGGRTLALFTSYRALDLAVEAMRKRLPNTILSQREYQKTQLVKLFTEDESSCLFATSGFFQGIDIPGRTLSLVTIDRIPFPRPDDPLLSARRDAIGDRAFREIDLPRAATLLAQATGRLIRNATDRGVVAVFDPRLGNAGYRRDILESMPPMRKSIDRAEVEEFLKTITR